MQIKPSSYLPLLLAFPLAALAAVLGHYAVLWPVCYNDLTSRWPELRIPFLAHGVADSFATMACVCCGAGGVLLLAAALTMFLRRGWVLWLYRQCCLAAGAPWGSSTRGAGACSTIRATCMTPGRRGIPAPAKNFPIRL
jgi:hypothetical protein